MIKITNLRQWLLNSKKNGLDKSIIKTGSKVVIDKAKFEEWIKESNGKPE